MRRRALIALLGLQLTDYLQGNAACRANNA
jgi:hypothetical protein